MTFRLSTLSNFQENGINYQTGDLSIFPEMIDDFNSLYKATNNAETYLRQSLTYNGKQIIVNDTSLFPDNGLIRIGMSGVDSNFELVYYANKNPTTFYNLVRGFAGSITQVWPMGTYVANTVQAEPHNAVKDAILNMQTFLGTSINPDPNSLNGMISSLENKYLAPSPTFKAFPLSGIPPLTVKFQNFSNSEAIRFLWDFGDGSISSDKSPTYTYLSEGTYTVKLNMIMSTGAQGYTTKTDYISVSNDDVLTFFYTKQINQNLFELIDQSEGDIASRYWAFGDGTNAYIDDPYEHTIRHTYSSSGTYTPSLLLVFADNTTKRVFLTNNITVQ